MTTYKLTYFNLRGLAETARYLFALAEQDYEDCRLDRQEWPTIKPMMPFGYVPVLEVEGVTICQSSAIARYLANKFGYAGKTALESAQCDMIVDSLVDMNAPRKASTIETDPAKQAEMKKKYEDEQMPEFLSRFENILVANQGGGGYFVGDGLTWADLAFCTYMDLSIAKEFKICWEVCPKLKALKRRVESHPTIADWIAKRPKTDL